MSIDVKNLTIKKTHGHLTKGDFSTVELAEAYLEEIEKNDCDIHAYLEVFDDVLEQAKRKEKTAREKDSNELCGIPIAFKDNILMRGRKASAGSKILENYTATYDATAIDKLKKAGAVFLGRTNMDEFAMGASTENSAFGVTKNPHDTARVPGGSSGGSAAAVAGNMALAALGSDTAGSIRQPSAFCGVVGLKPTYGSVSRNGLIALGSSLDCIGPIGKTVEDAEILFNVIKGKDKMDPTSVDESSFPDTTHSDSKSNTIGVPAHFLKEKGVDERILKNFDESVESLKKLGYTIKDIELPNAEYAVPAYYIILPAEASANLARFDGVKYGLHKDGDDLIDDYFKTRGGGFGPEPRRRIIIGTYVLSSGYYDAYYSKATALRRLIMKDFEEAFSSVGVIATPTTPAPAFKLGEKMDDPVQMYLEDVFTVPANHTGLPALSVPSGFVGPMLQENEMLGKGATKLPVGVQFISSHMHEHMLFSVGKRFENSLKSDALS